MGGGDGSSWAGLRWGGVSASSGPRPLQPLQHHVLCVGVLPLSRTVCTRGSFWVSNSRCAIQLLRIHRFRLCTRAHAHTRVRACTDPIGHMLAHLAPMVSTQWHRCLASYDILVLRMSCNVLAGPWLFIMIVPHGARCPGNVCRIRHTIITNMPYSSYHHN